MQGYLVDTNAISLVAPVTDTKRLTPGRAGFQRWIRAHSDNLFCSVITLAEVQAGISRLNVRTRAGVRLIWRTGSMRS